MTKSTAVWFVSPPASGDCLTHCRKASASACGVTLLDIPSGIYIQNTIDQLQLADFFTGFFKAGVFGTLIGTIACFNGLRVRGGAAGVGLTTTMTVVLSILLIILTDLIFTAMFYILGWT